MPLHMPTDSTYEIQNNGRQDAFSFFILSSAERFVVLDHAHRSLVQVQPLDVGGSSAGPYEHCFNLTLLENHQGRTMEKLLKAPSQ